MLEIECDPNKRDWTLRERGLDMAKAGNVLAGDVLTQEDDRQDYGEPRYISVGWLESRMVVLVWTPRYIAPDRTIYRIISMRKANDREQKHYRPYFTRLQ